MEDDQVLVHSSQNGDTEAFGVLYDRYVDKLYRFVYYKVFNKEAAEDIVSDVFLKALDKIGTYDSKRGTFSAWLYRIARNAVIDHYRTRKQTIPIEDTFDIGFDARTEEQHDAMNTLGKVSEYLKTLSPKQREVITLRVWEGLSYREIADIVGGSEDSVKMAFSRGIRDVREKCGPFAALLLIFLAEARSLPFHDLS